MDYRLHMRSDLRARRQHRFEKPEAAGTSPGDVSGLPMLCSDHLAFNQVRVAEKSDCQKCK